MMMYLTTLSKTKSRYIKILKKYTKCQKEKSRNHKMNNYKNIFFIGIGGIGMSALARYFHSVGKIVYGYDKTSTKLTRGLESLGMSVHYTDDLDNIPSNLAPENTLVVITPAIPKSHSEWNY